MAEGWPNGAEKLKSGMGLEHTRHRSSINAFVHTLSCPTNRLLKETLENSPLPQRPGRGINTDSRSHRLLVSHASLNPKRDLNDQEEDLLRNRKVAGVGQDTVCVHGHTPQRNGKTTLEKTRTGPVLVVDTGAVFTGCLTGMCFTEVGEG